MNQKLDFALMGVNDADADFFECYGCQLLGIARREAAHVLNGNLSCEKNGKQFDKVDMWV